MAAWQRARAKPPRHTLLQRCTTGHYHSFASYLDPYQTAPFPELDAARQPTTIDRSIPLNRTCLGLPQSFMFRCCSKPPYALIPCGRAARLRNGTNTCQDGGTRSQRPDESMRFENVALHSGRSWTAWSSQDHLRRRQARGCPIKMRCRSTGLRLPNGIAQ